MSRRLNSRRLNSGRLNRELDPRVAWLLMMLYPRDWRDRYGAEVLRLTRELIAAGETTPVRAAVNLAWAAVTERWRALGNSWRPAMAMTAAVLLAVAGGFYAAGHGRPARPASAPPATARLTSVLCSLQKPAPVKVGAGGAMDIAGIPQTGPVFTFNLPAGTELPPPAAIGPTGFVGLARGRGPLCVRMAALCDAGTGRTVTAMPGGLVIQVTVKSGACVLARSDKKAVSGP
jgi:hypothetical protein